MEEWKQYKLIDVLDTLIDYRGKTPRKTMSGIPLITAKIIKNGRIDTPNEFIAIEDYNSWMVRGLPKVGDVVLTTEAPLGEVAQLDDENVALAQRVVTLRGKAGVLDNTYLKYFLLSHVGQQRLKARETGTTVTGIKQSELREVLVDCPPYETQIQIASVLSSLDDKIEVNKRINDNFVVKLLVQLFLKWVFCTLINDNLEQQAQALFKSWFVDFEPFKDGEFIESELGRIPKGWHIGGVYEYVDVIYGAPYKSSLFNASKKGLPLIRIRDLKTFSPQYYTEEVLPTTEYIKAGDIVAGMDAEFVPCIWLGEKGVLNQRCCKFKSIRNDVSNYYTLFLLKPELEYVQGYKTGTTVSHLGKSDIDKFKVVVPPLDCVMAFSQTVNPLLVEVVNRAIESRCLTELRNALLPRLMSRELKVSEMKV